MLDSIMKKLEDFVLKTDLNMSFFYKTLSKDELHLLKDESLILKDFDTVKIVDKELERRNEPRRSGDIA